ncbi:helix-turn-helix domain-containing protein [Streptomyces sp. ODS28]|uniref:PucR family transcriptional regulator n=1 Tax=Streptomyces sp. ODS28 TaxID=3136688 RepID=UPI0031EB5F22
MVEAAGSGAVSVLAAPCGLDVPVRATVLHDCAEELPYPDGEGTVLLLVGAGANDARMPSLVRSAARGGYCAVVLKARGGDPAPLLAEAAAYGTAVLAAAETAPWRELDAVFASALGADGLGGLVAATDPRDELFGIANALATVVGGSVAIEDLGQRVLAYSSIPGQRIDELRERGILERQVPDGLQQPAQYRAVLAAGGPVRFPAAGDELPRIAVAVRAGPRPLGTIWAIQGPEGTGPEGEQALLEGARSAAGHLLNANDSEDRSRRRCTQTLRALLDGRPVADAARRLGLAPGTGAVLTGFAFTGPEAPGPFLTRQLGTVVRQWFAAFHPRATVAAAGTRVYALVPGEDTGTARRLANGALRGVCRVFDERVRAAVSAPVRDTGEIAAQRQEADEILRALAEQESGAHPGTALGGLPGPRELPDVAGVEDVHGTLVLDRLAQVLARDPRLRHPGVDRMLAYDAEHRTDYAATVLAWFDAVGDIASAARRLHLHPNTVRYRLRRAAERFDLDLTDPDTRLSTWLQLRLPGTG